MMTVTRKREGGSSQTLEEPNLGKKIPPPWVAGADPASRDGPPGCDWILNGL